ncbi:hypothetical protein CLAFUW4_00066 [Fulvia fulva]|uniref:Uncharacterized protein n=1 Tax=Passalora fulva TaxID=5499 RepID=A0A9Q8P345_PASFU|nr:uncharacterized protein CLAFUR5_00064 [Fulvia fulva]KAK4635512.1 hypothetical protein CLAFUR4_00066 [Fulvia fulva]KAK4637780.1 hypothetical protein CLAFUR0_00065 [Fulvia fulva]UJO11563.1 hypothetical protein CLAFUR5_00064 [Fulvia fulva]WPV09400.1 hypothetical protein CLAFUW4_00066 [Fulvia fulva]WPV23310.1 hypothetical protein CLAFUW7_00066 [Fulvia fulva]
MHFKYIALTFATYAASNVLAAPVPDSSDGTGLKVRAEVQPQAQDVNVEDGKDHQQYTNDKNEPVVAASAYVQEDTVEHPAEKPKEGTQLPKDQKKPVDAVPVTDDKKQEALPEYQQDTVDTVDTVGTPKEQPEHQQDTVGTPKDQPKHQQDTVDTPKDQPEHQQDTVDTPKDQPEHQQDIVDTVDTVDTPKEQNKGNVEDHKDQDQKKNLPKHQQDTVDTVDTPKEQNKGNVEENKNNVEENKDQIDNQQLAATDTQLEDTQHVKVQQTDEHLDNKQVAAPSYNGAPTYDQAPPTYNQGQRRGQGQRGGGGGYGGGAVPDSGSPCDIHGELLCNGVELFGLCQWGQVIWQSVAPGTACVDGEIAYARRMRV